MTPDASLAESQAWLRDNGDPGTRQAAIPVPRLPVEGHLPVVYAGTGTAAELADVDARGKLVLLTPTDICQGVCDFTRLRNERVAAAADAGATGVLLAAPGLTSLGGPSTLDQCLDGPQSCPAVQPYAALPVVSVPYAQAEALIKRIKAAPSHVRISLGGAVVPKAYAAAYHDNGQIPPSDHRIGEKDLDRVDLHFHAARPGVVHQLSWQQSLQSTPAALPLSLPHPFTQRTMTAFVKRENDAISQFTASWAEKGPDYFITHNRQEVNDMVLTGRNEIHWNAGPAVPGAAPQVRTASGFSIAAGPCSGCRQGDTFYPTVYLTGSGGGRQALIGIVDDELLQHEFVSLPSCGTAPSPTMPNLDFVCDFKLLNASGDPVERRTEHLPDETWTTL